MNLVAAWRINILIFLFELYVETASLVLQKNLCRLQKELHYLPKQLHYFYRKHLYTVFRKNSLYLLQQFYTSAETARLTLQNHLHHLQLKLCNL